MMLVPKRSHASLTPYHIRFPAADRDGGVAGQLW